MAETNQSRPVLLSEDTMSAAAQHSGEPMAATPAAEAAEHSDRTPLLGKWVLYTHLPNDDSWTLESYRRVMGFNTLEDGVALAKLLPEIAIKRCMLFLMRSEVEPRWEDPQNKDGGCFSYKVANKQIVQGWTNLMYSAMGETIFEDAALNKRVTGITISPKRSFSIIKIWLKDCSLQDPNKMNVIPGLSLEGCLFKRHMVQ